MLNKEQTEFLLTNSYNAAIRGGAAIMDVYNDGPVTDVDIKKDRSPLTQADMMSHTTIKKYLGGTHIPLLSEEGRDLHYDERRGWDLFWLVDPLDGTREFLKGNGEFTVNIALMKDNKPVLCVLYVPALKKIYFAVKGKGSYVKNDVVPSHESEYTYAEIFEGAVKLPLALCKNHPVKIAVSRSHHNELTSDYIESLKAQYPDIEVLRQGSSYKFCLLAEGAVDTYARHTYTYEWDTAAGHLILTESGGKIQAVDGTPIEYNKSTLLNPHFVCSSKYF